MSMTMDELRQHMRDVLHPSNCVRSGITGKNETIQLAQELAEDMPSSILKGKLLQILETYDEVNNTLHDKTLIIVGLRSYALMIRDMKDFA